MKKTKLLIVATLALATLSTTSCKKYSKGVCEVKDFDSSINDEIDYYCKQPNDEEKCYGSWLDYESYYHPDKSCNELGYKKKHSYLPNTYISKDGRNIPGENGYFSSDKPSL